MISNEDSMQLSKSCFNVCVAPKGAIQGNNVDDLDKPIKSVLENFERCVD